MFDILNETWGLFLERPSNLSGPKSNSWNYDQFAVKSCSFNNVSDTRKGKITAKFQSLKHVLIEDIFMSPEKFRDVRETGPWLWFWGMVVCVDVFIGTLV